MIINPTITGGGKLVYPLSPNDVYKKTRPADWLYLPTPSMGEIYMLFHIPSGGGALCAFKVVCNGNYTVELGTIINNAFSQMETYTVASGMTWEHDFDSADYGNETSYGMKQAVIKISGQNITNVEPTTYSSVSSIKCWNIVDIRCLIPDNAIFMCGGRSALLSLNQLRYFSAEGSTLSSGTGSGSLRTGMFTYCTSLMAVMDIDFDGQTDVSYLFSYCQSLVAIPDLNTAAATNFNNMFLECSCLPSVPQLNFNSALNMSGMFRSCASIREVPTISAPLATNVSTMFNSCSSLFSIEECNIPSAKNISAMFQGASSLRIINKLSIKSVTSANALFTNCRALGKILLDPSVTGFSDVTLAFNNLSMSHNALVSLLNSLPTVTSATLNISGNYGTSSLTSTEISAAEAKGWTIVT